MLSRNRVLVIFGVVINCCGYIALYSTFPVDASAPSSVAEALHSLGGVHLVFCRTPSHIEKYDDVYKIAIQQTILLLSVASQLGVRVWELLAHVGLQP